MKSENLVTCPNCKHQFSIESALTADIEKEIDAKVRSELNQKYILERKKDEERIKLKEEQIAAERKLWSEAQQKELFFLAA